MTTTLYVFWIGVPALFLFVGLWSWSEKYFGKKKAERPGDYFVNALVTAVATVLAIGIDQYGLPHLGLGEGTRMVCQIGLYPAVLYFGSLAIGPSKQILIAKLGTAHKRR